MTTYYERESVTHVDGTHIFATAEDARNEREVADLVERAWGCELHRFGALSPVDWYAVRAGRVVGLLELKSRPHPRDQYPTVFLNVRKWLALALGATGLGVPAVFVVRFVDGVFSVPLRRIDASRQRIGGTARRVKADSDIEPVIDVPVDTLTPLRIPEGS